MRLAGKPMTPRDEATANRVDIVAKPQTCAGAWKSDLKRYGTRPWLREQSIWAVSVYRFGRWGDRQSVAAVRGACNLAYWPAFRLVETMTGIGLPKLCAVGPGLRIHHFGGIFVHADVTIGSGCTLRHGITIGNRHVDGPVPSIGNDVDIGAYAQILGDIRIGDGARIGALSVVLDDVPDGATAVGVPARIVAPRRDSAPGPYAL